MMRIHLNANERTAMSDYNSPAWAAKFLDEWCRQTMRSRIEPMKKIARSLRQHRELILNYFRAQKLLSSGVVEGLPSSPGSE
jgi:transposase